MRDSIRLIIGFTVITIAISFIGCSKGTYSQTDKKVPSSQFSRSFIVTLPGVWSGYLLQPLEAINIAVKTMAQIEKHKPELDGSRSQRSRSPISELVNGDIGVSLQLSLSGPVPKWLKKSAMR